MGIIWACVSTILACVWVMLHLNLPGESDSRLTILVRKTKWFVMALLAPELVMLFAGGQWAAAQRSVKDMRAIGVMNWTMVHAFHAESGGFFLEATDSKGFPITSTQVHYLVSRGYIPVPTISTADILDHSKADTFAKAITGIQAGWFTAQIAARGLERLAVSLLELSTVCIMTCSAATLVFWWHKPLDVLKPIVLPCKYSIAEILVDAGESAKFPYQDVPLDFCEPIGYTSVRFPGNRFWGEQQRPLPRIPNDRDSLLHNWKCLIVISIPTAAFGTLQLIAWNFTFPTDAEQMLWRYNCLGGGVVLGTGCFLEAAAIVASHFKLPGMNTFNNYKTRWPWCLFFYAAGVLYVVARVIVIVEVIISLRALPESCFVTVQWTGLMPHI